MSKRRWLTAGDLIVIGIVMTVIGVIAVMANTLVLGSLPLIGLGVVMFAQGVVRSFRR